MITRLLAIAASGGKEAPSPKLPVKNTITDQQMTMLKEAIGKHSAKTGMEEKFFVEAVMEDLKKTKTAKYATDWLHTCGFKPHRGREGRAKQMWQLLHKL